MRILAVILAVSLAVIAGGCEDNASQEGPKVSDLAAERARVAAKVRKRDEQQKASSQVAATAANAEAPAAESELDTSMGGVAEDFVYDPRGKRDPFRSSFWNRKAMNRKVRGPLEQYELAQLAVAAIVWETNRPRALVKDPSGEGYIVKEGSRIGKNDGLVIHIGDNLVLVKETYIDFAGEQSTKDVEMRIRRSQGG